MWQNDRCWRIGTPAMAVMLAIAFAAAPIKISTPDRFPSPLVTHAEEGGQQKPEPAQQAADGPWISPSFRIGLIASYVEAVQRTAGLKNRAEELAKLVAALEARRLTDAEETIMETWLPEDLSDEERATLEDRLSATMLDGERAEIETRINSDLTVEERIAVDKKLLRNKAIDTALVPLRGELSSVEADLRQSAKIEKQLLDAIVHKEVTDDVVHAVNEFIWPGSKAANDKREDREDRSPKPSLVDGDGDATAVR